MLPAGTLASVRNEKDWSKIPLAACMWMAGLTLRLIDSCITQLEAQGLSRTCNESKEGAGLTNRGRVQSVDSCLGNATFTHNKVRPCSHPGPCIQCPDTCCTRANGEARVRLPSGCDLFGTAVPLMRGSVRESGRLRERDWYFIAEQPAPAPHLAHPEGCAALRIVLVTVTVPRARLREGAG